jgi:hypothetical protein
MIACDLTQSVSPPSGSAMSFVVSLVVFRTTGNIDKAYDKDF